MNIYVYVYTLSGNMYGYTKYIAHYAHLHISTNGHLSYVRASGANLIFPGIIVYKQTPRISIQ